MDPKSASEQNANRDMASTRAGESPHVRNRDPFADLQPGTLIGQYIVVDRLGQGGMGRVFLCHDRELGRKVALKCLLTSRHTAAEEHEVIVREAKAAAAINHPSIASVHHVIDQGDRSFMVMEYVDGETLAAALRRGPLPAARVVEIGRELAAALAAAHERGVVHRDLKPANIQIVASGGVKVLDFGVAKAFFAASVYPTAVPTGAPETGESFTVARGGTPPYMSPEQLTDRIVDARSDIFSLGVVLFEMATGRRPFVETDPISLAVAQTAGAPRAATIDPSVPRALDDVIARALAIDPSQRFQSATEIGDALARVSGQAAVDAARDVRRRQTRRLAIAGGAIVAVPLCLTVLGFLSSLAFNTTLVRTGPFAEFGEESLRDDFYWGAHSLIGPTVYLLIAVIAAGAIGFVLRAVSVIPGVGAVARWVRTRGRALNQQIGLSDPAVLAQMLSALAVVSIVTLIWSFRDFISAWVADINVAPNEVFEPIFYENGTPRAVYRFVLTVLIGVFGTGLYRVVTLRRRRASDAPAGSLVVLGAALAVMVVLVQLPYRILFRADFEKVDFGAMHCYAIGESPTSLLLYCPETTPPRNRVVSRTDPSLRRLGIVENIFHRQPPVASGR